MDGDGGLLPAMEAAAVPGHEQGQSSQGREIAESRECLAVHSARCTCCPTLPLPAASAHTSVHPALHFRAVSWHINFVDLTYKSILFTTGPRGDCNWPGDSLHHPSALQAPFVTVHLKELICVHWSV